MATVVVSLVLSVRDYPSTTTAGDFYYRLDGGPEVVVADPTNFSVDVPPGVHQLYFGRKDADGVAIFESSRPIEVPYPPVQITVPTSATITLT